MKRANQLFLILPVVLIVVITACEPPNRENQFSETASGPLKDSVTVAKVIDVALSQDPVHIEKAAEIEEIISRHAKRRQFNGTILVAEKGKVIYSGAFGQAGFDPEIELKLETPFHLASVSKQFTAMVIMMLKEENKLDYDDTVTSYLPDFPYKDVTIRQLLNHTSGIPKITDYVPYYLSFWDSCEIAQNHDLTAMLSKYQPGRQFYPGKRFSYNNTGYVVLAHLAEKISGKSFKWLVEEKIFKPLKMNNSFVYDIKDLNHHKGRARGYAIFRYSYVSDEDDIRNGLTGEKGVYSSAIDLYKWDQALYTDKLVKQQTLMEAFSRGKLSNGREIDYGFGWRMPRKEKDIVYHFGHWRGFRTCLVRAMDEQFTIILLNNTGSRKLKYLVLNILDVLYKDKSRKPKF